MDRESCVPVDPFQRRCEKLLFWAVIGLAEYHMFACSFREILPGYSEPFFRLERWIGAAILVALIVCLGRAFCRFPGSLVRFKPLLRRLRSFEQIYMLWMFFWYIAVLVIWQLAKGGSVNLFRENDWWLFEMALMAFVFFPMPRVLGGERAKQLIDGMLRLLLIPHMLVWAWILLQYFQGKTITFPSGGTLVMEPGCALSFGYNPNITGAGALVMMALCLYLVVSQNGFRKLVYGFGAAVYFIILVYSNCRTSWYCALMIAVSVCFFAVWFGMQGRHWLLRLLIGLAAGACCVLFLIWLRDLLFSFLINVCYGGVQAIKVGQAAQAAAGDAPAVASSAAAFARSASEDTGGLSGRVPLYLACRDVMLSRKFIFFFGLPSSDFTAAVFGRHGVDVAYSHAHNFLLTTGMYYGVPTMLLTAAFLISVFVRCFRLLFIRKRPVFRGFWMIPVILAALVAEDMMESFLSLTAWSMTCISFYWFAGWITAMDEESKLRG